MLASGCAYFYLPRRRRWLTGLALRNGSRRPSGARLVTPEGVDLSLSSPTSGQRIGAFLLDALIMVGILLALTLIAIARRRDRAGARRDGRR